MPSYDSVEAYYNNLMRRFKQGETQAFEKLVQANKQQLMSNAYRFTQNRVLAEAIVLYVFTQVYKLKNYRPDQPFLVWLYALFGHACLNKSGLHHYIKQAGSCFNDKTPAEVYSPKNEVKQALCETIMYLPPKARLVIILEHWENMPVKVIAEVMNERVEDVMTMLFKARAKCKIKLQAYLQSAVAE